MGRFDLSSIEGYVANHLRVFIISVIGLVIFVGIIALSVFFIAVHGEEQTMVPDVVGKELTQALIELQMKELYPRIQLRYSQSSGDKGFILEQEPKPGSITKAGRRIRLVVSQGFVLNKVESFVTHSIDKARMDIQVINASAAGLYLFTISEPIMYQYSSESPGTILAQKPEPGTEISGPVTMEFVVSKGRENFNVSVPQLTGLSLPAALGVITSSGINFRFTVRDKTGSEAAETVVSQSPDAYTVMPSNDAVQLTVTSPDRLAANEVFGLFSFKIPQNPYPLAVRLEALLPTGVIQRVFTVNYMGGEFTVPYKLPKDSMLILSMLNHELHREKVGE